MRTRKNLFRSRRLKFTKMNFSKKTRGGGQTFEIFKNWLNTLRNTILNFFVNLTKKKTN